MKSSISPHKKILSHPSATRSIVISRSKIASRDEKISKLECIGAVSYETVVQNYTVIRERLRKVANVRGRCIDNYIEITRLLYLQTEVIKAI